MESDSAKAERESRSSGFVIGCYVLILALLVSTLARSSAASTGGITAWPGPNMSLSLDKYTVALGGNVTVQVRLSYPQQNKPWSGLPVLVYVRSGIIQAVPPGPAIGDSTTDSNGLAELSFVAVQDPGMYSVIAWEPGNSTAEYGGAVSTAILNVVNHTTNISITVPESVGQGGNVTITASLVDDQGAPVISANVAFFANQTRIGDVITNSEGTAALTYEAYAPGTIQLQASYGGQGYLYAQSTSSVASMTVNASTSGPNNDGLPSIELVGLVTATILVLASFAITYASHRREGVRLTSL